MTDRERLLLYAQAVDELRRQQKLVGRMPNAFERKSLAQAAAEVDRLTALYVPTDEAMALPQATVVEE